MNRNGNPLIWTYGESKSPTAWVAAHIRRGETWLCRPQFAQAIRALAWKHRNRLTVKLNPKTGLCAVVCR